MFMFIKSKVSGLELNAYGLYGSFFFHVGAEARIMTRMAAAALIT